MLIELLYHQTHIYLLNSRLFCTALATLISFLGAMILFQPYIKFLRRLNFSSELDVQKGKSEPVMPAGILFLFMILLTSVICVRPNSYVLSALAIYTFFALIGAIDDIAKVVNKRRLVKGVISKKAYEYKANGISASLRLSLYLIISLLVALLAYKYIPDINGKINIPFLSIHKTFPYLAFWIFIPIMALTIAVMANGVNFTDGFDTLSTVPMITCYLFIGVAAFISSNAKWASYLLIPFIPHVEEILPLVGSVIGVLLAFLWFNAPPSTIIMGDSGSIALGGMIGIMFVFIKAMFYLPIIGFVFVLEFISVVMQIGYFKLTKGKRIFLMAPIHHHFQMKMRKNPFYQNEFSIKSKISWRLHIVSVVLLVVGLILFLKIR